MIKIEAVHEIHKGIFGFGILFFIIVFFTIFFYLLWIGASMNVTAANVNVTGSGIGGTTGTMGKTATIAGGLTVGAIAGTIATALGLNIAAQQFGVGGGRSGIAAKALGTEENKTVAENIWNWLFPKDVAEEAKAMG